MLFGELLPFVAGNLCHDVVDFRPLLPGSLFDCLMRANELRRLWRTSNATTASTAPTPSAPPTATPTIVPVLRICFPVPEILTAPAEADGVATVDGLLSTDSVARGDSDSMGVTALVGETDALAPSLGVSLLVSEVDLVGVLLLVDVLVGVTEDEGVPLGVAEYDFGVLVTLLVFEIVGVLEGVLDCVGDKLLVLDDDSDLDVVRVTEMVGVADDAKFRNEESSTGPWRASSSALVRMRTKTSTWAANSRATSLGSSATWHWYSTIVSELEPVTTHEN